MEGLAGRTAQLTHVRVSNSRPEEFVRRPNTASNDGHDDLAEEVHVNPGNGHLPPTPHVDQGCRHVDHLRDAAHVLPRFASAQASNPDPQAMQNTLPSELGQLSLEVGVVRVTQADPETVSCLKDNVAPRSFDIRETRRPLRECPKPARPPAERPGPARCHS